MAIGEVGHVHPERTVGSQIEELFANELGISRLAIRGEPHELVLATVDAKTTEVSEGRVQEPDRMWKTELLEEAYLITLAGAEAARCPLAHAVERQDGGLVERGREESTRGVGLVVAGENVAPLILPVQAAVQLPRRMELLFQPEGKSLEE